jgi:cysteine-rich repeat protein
VDPSGAEQCDQGDLNADDTYGVCSTECEFGPRCGDGTQQADDGEECDNTLNTASYDGCGPMCKLAPYCGDGITQPAREGCDDGTELNTGEYGGCTDDCQLAPFCGDNHLDVDEGEQCDDGNRNNFDGCSTSCQNEAVPI